MAASKVYTKDQVTLTIFYKGDSGGSFVLRIRGEVYYGKFTVKLDPIPTFVFKAEEHGFMFEAEHDKIQALVDEISKTN